MTRLLLTLLLALPLWMQAQDTTVTDMNYWLVRTGTEFNHPGNLRSIPADANDFIPHHVAFENARQDYEVRYFFVPLDSTSTYYNRQKALDPLAELADPNEYCQMAMELAVQHASKNKVHNFQIMERNSLKSIYRADWGATQQVDLVNEEIPFQFCQVICLHKNDLADVYIYYLTNDKNQLMEVMADMLPVFRFL